MDNSYTPASAPRPPRPIRRFLLITLFGLLAGAALVLWGLSRSPAARGYLLGVETSVSADAPQISVTAAPPPPTGERAVAPPTPLMGAEARIAALEARVDQLSRMTAGEAGSSSRSEGLLLAFAARRALDRGLALGYVEGRLSEHFGTSQPRAVAMIIAAARQPVTLDQLKSELEELAPALAGKGANDGWWDGVRQSLSGLFIVRQADAPSTTPAQRISRATAAVGLGRVDQALAEIARLPNRDLALTWMAKAKRHVEAYRALDLLEAAAIVGSQKEPPAPTLVLPDPPLTGTTDETRKAMPDSL